jgi:hypothetical protein
VPLDSFEVAFEPGTKAALLWVKGSPAEPCRWRIYNLSAPAGYKAAVHLKVPIANCNTMNGSGDFNLIFKCILVECTLQLPSSGPHTQMIAHCREVNKTNQIEPFSMHHCIFP